MAAVFFLSLDDNVCAIECVILSVDKLEGSTAATETRGGRKTRRRQGKKMSPRVCVLFIKGGGPEMTSAKFQGAQSIVAKKTP